MAGPLQGIRVIEIAGIGPGPFAAMMLADMGADVVRVDRAGIVKDEIPTGASSDLLARGRRSVGVDLKHPEGVETVLRMVEQADVITEGFRPGVMERLGLGPDECLARNPRLVYGRMTGFGQEGPLAQAAGHDINYIAQAGALGMIGRKGEPPLAPLNLAGDFGGGSMYLIFGILCALLERERSGQGQVVDAAMVDGAASLTTIMYMFKNMGVLEERGTNLLDSGAHFYEVYETGDGGWVSIGSIEPQFYAELLEKTGLAGEEDLPRQMDRSQWEPMKERLRAVFKTKTRAEWCELMEGSDVCFAPVLSPDEAIAHPANRARNVFVEVDGIVQPGPAPRFSRTRPEIQGGAPHPGEHTESALADWGFSAEELQKLHESGAIK